VQVTCTGTWHCCHMLTFVAEKDAWKKVWSAIEVQPQSRHLIISYRGV
jgi:hypothetical protein